MNDKIFIKFASYFMFISNASAHNFYFSDIKLNIKYVITVYKIKIYNL